MKPFSRREFCILAASASASWSSMRATTTQSCFAMVAANDRARILAAADKYLAAPPVTVTASHSDRSPGGPHDYFSEGDYWWPDPDKPDGLDAYITLK